MNVITIALAEDNVVNKKTFVQKMRGYQHLHLLFTADTGADFLEQLKGLPISKHPMVVFMDIEMPEMDGIQAIQIAKALYPHIHFIVLTVFDDDEKIFEAIQSGAIGYLLKDEPGEEIKNAIDCVLQYGGSPMSPAIARKALQLLGRSRVDFEQKAKKNNELETLLSAREIEILQYVVQGYDSKQTGDLLEISLLTVRKHVANIYQKLHVNSRGQIIHLATNRKWFEGGV